MVTQQSDPSSTRWFGLPINPPNNSAVVALDGRQVAVALGNGTILHSGYTCLFACPTHGATEFAFYHLKHDYNRTMTLYNRPRKLTPNGPTRNRLIGDISPVFTSQDWLKECSKDCGQPWVKDENNFLRARFPNGKWKATCDRHHPSHDPESVPAEEDDPDATESEEEKEPEPEKKKNFSMGGCELGSREMGKKDH